MIRHQLKDGRAVLLDEQDAWIASKYILFVSQAGYVLFKKCGRDARLHREVMSAPRGLMVDHINQDKLDNRRANLRVCSAAENQRNKKRYATNASGFKGVYLDKSRNRPTKWRAEITVNYKKIRLGYFLTPELAHEAYWRAAQEMHKEYARQA